MKTLTRSGRVTGIVLTWLLAGSMSDGASADSGMAFVDVTNEIGVSLIAARGTAFGDYDNDGWPDLLATGNLYGGTGTAVFLLGNQGNGVLRDDAAALPSGIGESLKGGGSIFGDYDNDGDLDAFIPVGAFKSTEAGRNLLLRNDRGRFVEVGAPAGLTDEVPTDNAVWFDYDRDGNLDLYVGNIACDPPECSQELRNALYSSNGDGTFTDRTAETGLLHSWTLETGCMPNGSNGGLLAADFSDDGWPDLYVSMYGGANLLFLSQGEGRFALSTSPAISDSGRNWGAAVGDVDNDGDLDLVQTSRARGPGAQSQLLVNRGSGVFEDGTYAAGLASLTAQDVLGCALGDIDNDGDLDLLTGDKHFLFLNDGRGAFTSATSASGITGVWLGLSLGDYDLDGDLDAWYGTATEDGRLYRNLTSGNHWLIVELVGVRSNRTGIGARVIATTRQRRQTREVSGGMGYCQHEPVAHFGLGQDQVVEELEIRWPSGQVDRLPTIPGDQRIRVIEGSGGWETAAAAAWEVAPQATPAPAEGATVRVYGILRPALFCQAATLTRVIADLSALGGPAEVSLTPRSHGRYRLDITFVATTPAEVPSVVATVEQTTPVGPRWSRIRYTTSPPVTPPVKLEPDQTTDLLLINDDEGDTQYDLRTSFWGWISGTPRVRYRDADVPIFRGTRSASVTVAPQDSTDWLAGFFLNGSGYHLMRRFPGVRYLHLAFHPGDAVGSSLSIGVDYRGIELLGPSPAGGYVQLGVDRWQILDLPLELFEQAGTEILAGTSWQDLYISNPVLYLRGNLRGTFYLDDVRLVAAPITAVSQESAALPVAPGLEQNYPNPFNGSTALRVRLPVAQTVRLEVFDLTGQLVAILADHPAVAGEQVYRWDGTDQAGNPVGSGVYLCRVQAGPWVATRKVVLLR